MNFVPGVGEMIHVTTFDNQSTNFIAKVERVQSDVVTIRNPMNTKQTYSFNCLSPKVSFTRHINPLNEVQQYLKTRIYESDQQMKMLKDEKVLLTNQILKEINDYLEKQVKR